MLSLQLRGGAVRQLVGLITQRSLVQIRPPLLSSRVLEQRVLEPFLFYMASLPILSDLFWLHVGRAWRVSSFSQDYPLWNGWHRKRHFAKLDRRFPRALVPRCLAHQVQSVMGWTVTSNCSSAGSSESPISKQKLSRTVLTFPRQGERAQSPAVAAGESVWTKMNPWERVLKRAPWHWNARNLEPDAT